LAKATTRLYQLASMAWVLAARLTTGLMVSRKAQQC
jgi:hypothetical protein